MQRTSLPLFIIVGEQKCGTTFLRALLGQHPLLRPGTGIYGKEVNGAATRWAPLCFLRRLTICVQNGETHFFDWGMMLHKVHHIPEVMMQSYARYFTSRIDEDAVFGFDTSPSYLAWPDEIPK